MPRIQVRPFAAEFAPDAAALLAARQRRLRGRLPMLAKAFEEPRECEALIRRALSGSLYGGGYAALAGDRLAGYLLAEKHLHAPQSLSALYIPPYTMAVSLAGHAVADWADATEVLRLLYAQAAEQWVAGGFFEHRAYVPAGDLETQEAFLTCGFGRQLTCAVRSTEPPAAEPLAAGVEIHTAGSEDLEVVMKLEHTNATHHWRSPIFWPVLHETDAAARAYQAGLLADPANAHFIAYRGGQPVGMDTFNPPDWISPLLQGGRMVYLYQGVVEEEVRGGGLGKALLARSMSWAREEGYDLCALHFASMNASGGPFWLSQGFVPVEHTMSRRIDERIAWARP